MRCTHRIKSHRITNIAIVQTITKSKNVHFSMKIQNEFRKNDTKAGVLETKRYELIHCSS